MKITKTELKGLIRESIREELATNKLIESQFSENGVDDPYNRKQKMYCVETPGGEYELVYEINGKVVDRQFSGSFENVMLDCYDFFRRNSEKYELESRVNTLEVKLEHTFY
jgi:hypothetical protein